ncbi:MAG TPA: DUF5667 domain-containing protein [Mycobacteriales bacterium]|nr:DUF5667 domain-containing protein [Mycobacteriales bacterium]
MRRPTRSAEQFAVAVDSTSVDAARDPALSPLLALAQQLQALPLGPSDDFRTSLRTRLMAVAAVAPAELPAPGALDRARDWVSGWRVQRGLAAATASMAAVIGIAGVSTAGMRSLPGDPFYSVKRTTEGVQLALTRGDVARGKRHLVVAETRLEEVSSLVGDPSALAYLGAADPSVATFAFGGSTSELVRETLHDMDAATRTGTRLLTEAYQEDRETAPLKALASFVKRQKAGLAEVLPALPAGAREAGAASLQLVAEVETRANALLTNGVCGPDCAPAPSVPMTEEPAASPAPPPAPAPDGSDDLGPAPCDCAAQPTPEPSPTTDPQPQPSPSPTSAPAPSPSPSPSREPRLSDLVPSAVPEPVRSPVVEVIDTIEDLLPTPLPAPIPMPIPAADTTSTASTAAAPSPAPAPAPRPAAGPLPLSPPE